eukprot:c23822_g1_i2 orf=494-826(-)
MNTALYHIHPYFNFIMYYPVKEQILTNGKYQSVEHRVVTNTEKARMSIPCFFCPDMDARIAPLPAIKGEGKPALYKEFVFREYLQRFNGMQTLTRKVCLEYARAEESTER